MFLFCLLNELARFFGLNFKILVHSRKSLTGDTVVRNAFVPDKSEISLNRKYIFKFLGQGSFYFITVSGNR